MKGHPVTIDSEFLRELCWDSYQLHECKELEKAEALRNLHMVRELWELAIVEEKIKEKKKKPLTKIKSVELLYKNWQDD